MGGVALQNENHFLGNCESLWQSVSQNCESLLADLRITFQMVSQKKFVRQNFPVLRHILCI